MHEFVFRSRKYLSAWYIPDGSYSNPCVQPTWDWQSVSTRRGQREWKRDLWRSEWLNLGFQISLILEVLATSNPYVKMNEFWDFFFNEVNGCFLQRSVLCVCFSMSIKTSSSEKKTILCLTFVTARHPAFQAQRVLNFKLVAKSWKDGRELASCLCP